MKEVKAYIRRDAIDEVVEELRRAGAPGVSIIEIHPLGYGYEPNPFEPHVAGLVDRYRYLSIVKLEIMCTDAQLPTVIQVIQIHCRTGNRGDGMIFVSDIVDAIRISDGTRGEPALGEHRPRNGEGARHNVAAASAIHQREEPLWRLRRAKSTAPSAART